MANSPITFGTGTAYFTGTNASTSWQPLGTVQSINAEPYTFKVPKYWWKFTHYECPLCGSVDTVRERINIVDEPKPSNPDHRHFYKEIACGYHFT